MSAKGGVAVLGAGLGGLATATFLQAAGVPVTLFERAGRPGGRVCTTRLDAGTLLEHGPLGWLDKEPAALDLCDLLGLTPTVAADVQKERRLWKEGRIHALPKGPLSFLGTPVMPLGGRLRLLMEPFVRRRDPLLGEETVDAFARRRFGEAVADNLFAAMVAGIYGGDPRRLSVQAAFPLMADWERDDGSCIAGALSYMRRLRRERMAGTRRPTTRSLVSLPGGMAEMTDAMAERLGDAFRPGSQVARLRREGGRWLLFDGAGSEVHQAEHLVMATPSGVSAELLSDEAPELQDLPAQRVAPLAVVHLLLRQEQVAADLASFGFLALRDHGLRALGVQYASSIFPGQTAAGLVQLRALLGGVHDPEILALDDDALIDATLAPLVDALRITGVPVHAAVTRLPAAIPQYELGHLALRQRFEDLAAARGGLYFAGDALHGVGVTAVAARAQAVARDIVASG
jgi:oxygen-dependent protoporphyrinogen oxidase